MNKYNINLKNNFLCVNFLSNIDKNEINSINKKLNYISNMYKVYTINLNTNNFINKNTIQKLTKLLLSYNPTYIIINS